MAPLARDRKIWHKTLGPSISVPVTAATKVYAGSIASVLSGYLLPAAATANHRVMGIAMVQGDNTAGAAGAVGVQVMTGVFKVDNDATNPVVQADVGKPCYVIDDHTVRTTGAATPIVAGIVHRLESDGVWVDFNP